VPSSDLSLNFAIANAGKIARSKTKLFIFHLAGFWVLAQPMRGGQRIETRAQRSLVTSWLLLAGTEFRQGKSQADVGRKRHHPEGQFLGASTSSHCRSMAAVQRSSKADHYGWPNVDDIAFIQRPQPGQGGSRKTVSQHQGNIRVKTIMCSDMKTSGTLRSM
jgi:hypothetical protein